MKDDTQALAQKLGISEKQFASMRLKFAKDHGKQGEAKLLKYLKGRWKEMRDEDLFLRTGALPSDMGGRPSNPRSPALSRGRTGMRREPGEAKKRHHKSITKPPNQEQIKEASKQSAYMPYRDRLDAGSIVPPDEVGGYRSSVQARLRFLNERSERVSDLWGACQQIRSAVDDLEPQVKRGMGRELWRLKSNLDALERKLKRDVAA